MVHLLPWNVTFLDNIFLLRNWSLFSRKMAGISFVVSRNLFTAVSDCREWSSATVNSISFRRKLPAVKLLHLWLSFALLEASCKSFKLANFKRTVVTFVEKLRLLWTGPFHKVSLLDTVVTHLSSVSRYQFNWTSSFCHRLQKRVDVRLVLSEVYTTISDDPPSKVDWNRNEPSGLGSKLPHGKSDTSNL